VAGPPTAHYRLLAEALARGKAVPFLGAGINLYDRNPRTTPWTGSGGFLPTGRELAAYLAERYGYVDTALDLARVSQWGCVLMDQDDLYGVLHDLFASEYRFNPLHAFFARLPSVLAAKGYDDRYQLIITTNYDDALESAFDAANEPYDLVWYAARAKDESSGRFFIRPHQGVPEAILNANTHDCLLEERSVILKIHGAVHRAEPARDSYVIAEDHYIDYLSQSDIWNLIPVRLKQEMCESHFLFLGYSMQDWNLRVLFNRIASEAQLTKKSWAIQPPPDDDGNPDAAQVEEKLWKAKLKDLDVLNVSLRQYIEALEGAVEELASRQIAAA
jgi:hypothetical protein